MYQRILVPIDGSMTAQRGVAEAVELARLTQGHLRLVHCIDDLSCGLAMEGYGGTLAGWLEELRADGRRLLDQGKAVAAAAGIEVDAVLHDKYSGSVAELVAREAATWPADLIVLGTHGRRGVGRMFMGSGAEQILRLAPVPVLLVRAAESSSHGHGVGFMSGAAPLC